MITRAEYIKDVKLRLDELDNGITKIENKVEKVRENAKEKLKARIIKLRERRDAALSKIQEINNTSEETWQDLKKSTENVVSSLKTGLTKTLSHFKKKKAV